jgi:hypothetical protein
VQESIPKWLKAIQVALVEFGRSDASGRITLLVSKGGLVRHIETERTVDFLQPRDDAGNNEQIRFKLEAADRRRLLGHVEVFEVKVRKSQNKTALEILERMEL